MVYFLDNWDTEAGMPGELWEEPMRGFPWAEEHGQRPHGCQESFSH